MGMLGEERQTVGQLWRDGVAAVGTAKQVLDELMAQKEEMSFGGLAIYFHFGNLPVEKAAASVEKFAGRVMPALKRGLMRDL